ncbi:MAG: DeoR/GlpR family DNA-binding transcription regulator [Actinomycetaceae bacterium]|nr:DeoR/GlpR family DNA-binding transcription regulator [Actinomycetaceae bacterium]
MSENTRQMQQNDRQREIVQLAMRHGAVSVEDMVRELGVSTMTVYRDVAALEAAGLVRRQRGKIIASASGLHEASAHYRLEQESASKRQIAKAVAPLIQPGESIMLDDSTSSVWLLRELLGSMGLSVVTNSLLVASQLQGNDNHSLFMLGGEYQPWADATMGPITIATLEKLHADVCVISASGVRDEAFFHPYADVAAVKKKMMEVSERTVLLLDHTKFSRRALHAFASVSDIDVMVVDAKTRKEDITRYRDMGVRVLVAGK